MSRLGRELLYHRIEAASSTDDRKALELVLQEYGMVLQQAVCEHASVITNHCNCYCHPVVCFATKDYEIGVSKQR